MIVYKTTCSVNNKIYIGVDSRDLPDYFGSGKIFKNAFKKHGAENFKKEILERCETLEHLYEREIYWISFYDSTNPVIGYNISKGGNGSTLCGENHPRYVKFSEVEIKEIIEMYKNRNSLTKIGHKFKVSKTKITSVLKQEGISIRTLSDIASNRVFSESTRSLMSEKRKGENNSMYSVSVYDSWVKKYGLEKAEELKLNYSKNMKASLIESHFKRKETGNDWGFGKTK